jgi:hypothetical protein
MGREKPAEAISLQPATTDKPRRKKAQRTHTGAIERAIKKVRQARKLMCNDKDYELWNLLYDAEEFLLKGQNGAGK